MSFNEKLSYTEHVVTTPATDFGIGFKDYGADSDTIKVTVDDVLATEAGYTVFRKNAMTIALEPAVTSGVVRLQRETNIDSSFYRFTAGAKFVAANMDANFEQILHSQQETRDGFNKLYSDVIPLVTGLEGALAKADEASEAAQAAAQAATEAAATANANLKATVSTVPDMDSLKSLEVWEDRIVYVQAIGVFKYVDGVWLRDSAAVTPEQFGSGVLTDFQAFNAMLLTKPKYVVLRAGKRYVLDTPQSLPFIEDTVFIGNGATVVFNGQLGLVRKSMYSAPLSISGSVGDTAVTVTNASQFKVGDQVLVFQNLGKSGSDIDPYFASVQNDVDNGEYSSHVNSITSVNLSTNTLGLSIPLEFNAPVQTALYIIDSGRAEFIDTHFEFFEPTYTNWWLIDNACNIRYDRCQFSLHKDTPATVIKQAIRVNTCYKALFTRCVFNQGTGLSIEYGSFASDVSDTSFFGGTTADALLMIWCAATNCNSYRNRYIAGRTGNAGITGGLYIGAKTRHCVSVDDYFDGLAYGFRCQWGAVGARFVRPVVKRCKTFSAFIDYTHDVAVIDPAIYDKPLRTVGAYRLHLKGGIYDGRFRGTGAIPLMVDINRGDTTQVRDGYVLEGITVLGQLRSWVALTNTVIRDVKATVFSVINTPANINLTIRDCTFGYAYIQRTQNLKLVDTVIDIGILGTATYTGGEVRALGLAGDMLASIKGCTIRHPVLGVEHVVTGSTNLKAISIDSDTDIFAPTQFDTGVTASVAPTLGGGQTWLAKGHTVRLPAIQWVWNGSSWVGGMPKKISTNIGTLSFTPKVGELFTTSRTINGVSVGDSVHIYPTVGSEPLKGIFYAQVTAPNTVIIHYLNATTSTAIVQYTNVQVVVT